MNGIVFDIIFDIISAIASIIHIQRKLDFGWRSSEGLHAIKQLYYDILSVIGREEPYNVKRRHK